LVRGFICCVAIDDEFAWAAHRGAVNACANFAAERRDVTVVTHSKSNLLLIALAAVNLSLIVDFFSRLLAAECA
jgi:hypothetical protein